MKNRRNTFATPLEKATFATLHTVALAAPALREGLSANSASFALPYLRQLLDTCALTMTDNRGTTLAWDGDSDQHEPDVRSLAEQVIATGRQQVLSHTAHRLRAPRLRGARASSWCRWRPTAPSSARWPR